MQSARRTAAKRETPRRRLLLNPSTKDKFGSCSVRAKVESPTPPMQITATAATAFWNDGRKNMEE
jgi:hypothetical protein